MPEEVFNAYLAGFTDGEGYLGANQPEGMRIILANCVPDVLRDIQARLGYGSIKSQKQRDNWRERFTLDISNMCDAYNFLTRCRPYFQIKAVPADEMLRRIASCRAAHDAIIARNAAIVMRAEAGEMRKALATEYGVSPQLISRICKGHKWPSERSRTAKRRKRDKFGRFTEPYHLASPS
jgi:hypothetical protein